LGNCRYHVNLRAPTVDRETPLLRAASEGHLEVVQLLIDNGADVNARTTGGGTPLHYATSHLEVVRRLLDNGADVNVKGHKGATALHFAAAKGNVAVARLLIERGADVNARDLSGQTPFQLAARYHHVEMGQVLFEAGAEEPVAAAREHLFSELTGVRQARVSPRGSPVCPNCGHEFPIAAKDLREKSDGIPGFTCPKCNQMARL